MACGTPVIAFNRGSVPRNHRRRANWFSLSKTKKRPFAISERLSSALSRRDFESASRNDSPAPADGVRISYGLSQSHRERGRTDSCPTEYARPLVHPAPSIAANFVETIDSKNIRRENDPRPCAIKSQERKKPETRMQNIPTDTKSRAPITRNH